jgi:hypothetical protein
MEETKVCAVCGSATVHYDGACEQCLGRKHQPSAQTAQYQPQATYQQGPFPPQYQQVPVAPRRHLKVPIVLLVLLAILVALLGEAHIVHGGGVGLTVCQKDGWSLSDTVVDLDDYIGKPLLANIEKAKVIRAMFQCGTLEPPQWVRDQQNR